MAEDGLEALASQLSRYMELGRRVMRRWWLVGGITVVAGLISVVVAVSLTRYYESRTLISYKDAVNKREVFEDTSEREEHWLEARLQETFTSRTLQMAVIREFDLYPDLRHAVAPEVVLEEFYKKINFDTVGADSFWISFEYMDPKKTQQVTAKLADAFIQQQVEMQIYSAQATLSFMEKMVKQSKAELDFIEEEVARFVSDHPEYQIDLATGLPRGGTLPVVPSRHRPRPIAGSSPELREALAKKGRLEAQLQLMRTPASEGRLQQVRRDFDRARARVVALKRQYTDRHPDVLRATAYMRQMQMQLQVVRQAYRSKKGDLRKVKAQIRELDAAIAALSRKARRSAKPRRPAPKKKRSTNLSAKAKLEKRFYQLSRDREVTKAKYEQIQTQYVRSRVSSDLERKQAESLYTVVDRANFPGKPKRPSRTKTTMAGTSLGLMLGLGLAVLLALFDPRIYNESDLKRVSDLPVLAQIPKDS